MTDYAYDASSVLVRIEDLFDDHLNSEGMVTVAGLEFTPSDVLKECDPTAYRVHLNDWLSGEMQEGNLFEYSVRVLTEDGEVESEETAREESDALETAEALLTDMRENWEDEYSGNTVQVIDATERVTHEFRVTK